MARDLGTEDRCEERQRQPRPQVRADPADATVGRELEDHRVGHPYGPDPGLAEDDAVIALADGLRPAKVVEGSVDGPEQCPDVFLPAEDHAAGDRRDDLHVGRERLHQRIDVSCLGGGPVTRNGVLHTEKHRSLR